MSVRQRISYKVAVISYKTRSTSKPAYLSDVLQDYRPARTWRSSDKLLLSVPRMALRSRRKRSASAPLQFGTRCHISVDLLNCLARSGVSYKLNCSILHIVNVNSLPSVRQYAPLIRLRRMALYTFVLIDWLIDKETANSKQFLVWLWAISIRCPLCRSSIRMLLRLYAWLCSGLHWVDSDSFTHARIRHCTNIVRLFLRYISVVKQHAFIQVLIYSVVWHIRITATVFSYHNHTMWQISTAE